MKSDVDEVIGHETQARDQIRLGGAARQCCGLPPDLHCEVEAARLVISWCRLPLPPYCVPVMVVVMLITIIEKATAPKLSQDVATVAAGKTTDEETTVVTVGD